MTQSQQPPRIGLLVASVRQNRLGPAVATWLSDTWSHEPSIEIQIIDLAEHNLPANLENTPEAQHFRALIDTLDALVVVTPEYNHSYPGNLKIALDLLGKELARKPVTFVSYGGISAGVRAVEHLRPIFSELGAITTKQTMGISMPWTLVKDGAFTPTDRTTPAAQTMLDDLMWWIDVLWDQNRNQSVA